ncbi:MAG: peptide ABC transporter substrate-binding protein [Anaerolineae bacterium]|nr:peptide ABC transporter substrate-binding protein [Anaerolineae bacterium]
MGLLLVLALFITACTATGGDIQGAIESAATQVGPTVEAAIQEVAPTLEAAATELAPTVEAAVEEIAPTVEAVATQVAGGEEAAGDLMVVSADCDAEGYTGLFKEIAAIDPMTVQFSMCAPDPAFPSKVAFSAFGIQPSEYLESTGGTGELLEKPVGTGPYIVESWNRGEELVYTKNANYWGEPAFADTLVFRWQTESAARLLELQSGTVDGIDNPAPDDFETISADSNLQLLPRPALNVFYVGMNNTYAPFDNVLVRQAIAMGIDRQRIVDNFYPAGSEVATHFTPCSIPNGCAGDEWYEFDPEAARALLAEAGFADGFETTITYRDVVRGYLPDPNIVAQDIQAQLLENLNINAEIVVMESGAFLEAADAGTIEGLHLLGWGADYPDMTNFLDYHFGAGSSDQFGAHIPELTDVLAQAASLAGDDARAPFYEQANNIIREQVPMVPVAHGGSGVAYLASVQNAHVSPLGNESFAKMDSGKDTFVWMQNAEPISLYCADETDGESLRACEQTVESLLAYEVGGTAVEPSLATGCEPNEDLTVWTCTLREGVTFHDGSALDANDVVMSYVVQWDAANPLHVGNTGAYSYFSALWGGFLNAPPAE